MVSKSSKQAGLIPTSDLTAHILKRLVNARSKVVGFHHVLRAVSIAK